jgi:hypothetical protein
MDCKQRVREYISRFIYREHELKDDEQFYMLGIQYKPDFSSELFAFIEKGFGVDLSNVVEWEEVSTVNAICATVARLREAQGAAPPDGSS